MSEEIARQEAQHFLEERPGLKLALTEFVTEVYRQAGVETSAEAVAEGVVQAARRLMQQVLNDTLAVFEEHVPLKEFSRIFDEEAKRLDPSGEGVPSEVVRDAVRERLYREYGNRLGPGWQSKSDGG
jgi:hypothetical protein